MFWFSYEAFTNWISHNYFLKFILQQIAYKVFKLSQYFGTPKPVEIEIKDGEIVLIIKGNPKKEEETAMIITIN